MLVHDQLKLLHSTCSCLGWRCIYGTGICQGTSKPDWFLKRNRRRCRMPGKRKPTTGYYLGPFRWNSCWRRSRIKTGIVSSFYPFSLLKSYLDILKLISREIRDRFYQTASKQESARITSLAKWIYIINKKNQIKIIFSFTRRTVKYSFKLPPIIVLVSNAYLICEWNYWTPMPSYIHSRDREGRFNYFQVCCVIIY